MFLELINANYVNLCYTFENMMFYKILILCLATIYKNDSESGEKVTPRF